MISKFSERRIARVATPSYLIVGALLLVFIQTFSLMSPIYLSFLLTILISLAINPLVSKLRTIAGGRQGATGLVVLSLTVVISLSGWAFFHPLKESLTNFSEVLPTYWERLQKPLIRLEQQANLSEVRLQAEVTSEIANEDATKSSVVEEVSGTDQAQANLIQDSNTIRAGLAQMLRGIVGSFTKVAFNSAQILVVLVTVFFGVVFMLMNPRPIIGSIFSCIPENRHVQAVAIMQRICRFAPAWGGSTLAGMLTIGLLVFLLMWPLLGFMDALVLGLIAGLLESVPFLGPTLSTLPALLLALGKGGLTPLWVLIAYIGVQALENNLILPLIMAKGMKLHAVAVIFSMLICVAAFGVLGVLIAAPLVAILNIIHEELYRKKYLPSVTDEDLEGLARQVMHEKSPEID